MPLKAPFRRELQIYLSRSGLTLPELAKRIGYSVFSLRQFNSEARYGDGQGGATAGRLLTWLRSNPITPPAIPGKLHETRATREMDALLDHVKKGGWGILYGPSGAQKTFFLEYRNAEAAQEPEPRVVYIRSSPAGMTPNVLLRRIAAGIGAPSSRYTDGIRQSVLYTIRQRRTSLALVLDEADALYSWVSTLETLREIGDLARSVPGSAGAGILMAGNERVMQIFENRRGIYFEKWRGRIEQQELRVLGPSVEEAIRIVGDEVGDMRERAVQAIVEGCVVSDPVTRKNYVNMHRLFNTITAVSAQRSKTLSN